MHPKVRMSELDQKARNRTDVNDTPTERKANTQYVVFSFVDTESGLCFITYYVVREYPVSGAGCEEQQQNLCHSTYVVRSQVKLLPRSRDLRVCDHH